MNNKLITICITLVVGIILAGSVLMPVLNDATETNGKITNSGFYRMSDISDETEWTIVWDHTDLKNVKVNGETVAMNPVAGGIPMTLIGGNDLLVRYFLQSNGVRVFVQEFNTGSTVYAADSNASQDMTITYSNGNVVCDNGSGTTRTVAITDTLYAVDPNGEFILKKSDETAYVKEDSKIIGLGTTELANNVDQRFVIEGSINDGFTAEYEPYDTMTMGEITDVYTANASVPYLGVYDFDKLTFTATYNDADKDVVYSQIFVPYEITAEKSSHMTTGQIALMGAIPIMVIIALLMVAVGVVARRND